MRSGAARPNLFAGLLWVGAIPWLSSCGLFGVKEENWPEKAADVSCHFAKRCDTANFWAQFDDVEHCIAETKDLLEDEADLYDGCTFDSKNAGDCLSAMRSNCKEAGQSYDALFAACYDVWVCENGRPFDTATGPSLPSGQ